MAKELCGIIHPNDEVTPIDSKGCLLPIGHDGPHEFVAPNGWRFQWETDLECNFEHCMDAKGDYCTTYWEVTPNNQLNKN